MISEKKCECTKICNINVNSLYAEFTIKCEFNLAAFGMINLETCFSSANTALKDAMDLAVIVEKLSTKPKSILGLKTSAIEEGNLADLTLFDPSIKWIYLEEIIF